MEILFPSIRSSCKMVICLKILYILSFGYKVLLIFIRSNLLKVLLKWPTSFLTCLSTLSISFVTVYYGLPLCWFIRFSLSNSFCFMNFKAALSVKLLLLTFITIKKSLLVPFKKLK